MYYQSGRSQQPAEVTAMQISAEYTATLYFLVATPIPMIHPQSLSAAWLARETDSGSWQRGSRYFRDGHAELDEVERLPDGGVRLVGSCRGSQFEPYRQHVEIYGEGKNIVLDGECSCPVEFNCKHVVALVLTWQALAPREPAGRDDVANEPANAIDAWLAEWPSNAEQQADSSESLLYLLDRAPGPRGDIEINFCISRRKKDGDWGKGRATQPSAIHNSWHRPDYLRAIDEEILTLIEASTEDAWAKRVYGFGRGRPPGADQNRRIRARVLGR